MGVTQCMVMAIKSLASSKMRAFLTMLGIIIGVGAVILIMSMGNGLTVYINDLFAEIGTTTITVNLTGRGSTRTVTADDMYDFYDEHTDVFSAMTPNVNTGAGVKIDPAFDTDSYTAVVYGVNEDYVGGVKKYEIEKGRGITYADCASYAKVCVVGAFYDYLYEDGAVGNYLKLNGEKYTVVGVLDEQDDRTDEDGGDTFVLVPYTAAAKYLSRTSAISAYTFIASREDLIDSDITLLKTRLYETYKNSDLYTVTSNSTIMDMMNEMIGTMVTILAGIAAISLVVGGIGIMNIMLVSVTERTREIGIRKALGAKGRHIKLQFVIEAGTTSAIGGVLGILLGVLGARAVSMFIEDFTAVPTFEAVLLSFGISVAIGVLFGYLPARKAASLNPIDALRYE